MKVGDLVCLSEYGIARDYNAKVTNTDPHQLGIIVEIKPGIYPFKVHWMKSHAAPHGMDTHSRRELKYAGR